MPGKVIQVVTLGSPPPALARDLDEPLSTQLGVTVVHGNSQLQGPGYAFNKDRNQFHSNAIMRRLVPLLEPGQKFVLGLTDVDLFIPESPFVFGEADRETKVAVVSVFRLKVGAEGEVLKRRTQIETVHQTGHLLGLSYCEDNRCVMFLANSTHELDRKGLSLCSACRNELAKINR